MDLKIDFEQLLKEKLLSTVTAALFPSDSSVLVKYENLSNTSPETYELCLLEMRKMFLNWRFEKLKDYFQCSYADYKLGSSSRFPFYYLIFHEHIAPRILQDELSGLEDLLCRNAYRVLKQTQIEDFDSYMNSFLN